MSWILDSKAQDFGFHKQKFKFLGFRNPDSFGCPAPKTCYAVFLFFVVVYLFKANILLAAESCVIPLGIESGHLPDDTLSASSYYSANYYPHFSRLNNIYQKGNDGSWCTKTNDGNQWLQVNFGRETTVTKVATQGRNNGGEWVISYSLSYSTDGIHWASYTLMDGHIKVDHQSSCCLNIKHNEYQS